MRILIICLCLAGCVGKKDFHYAPTDEERRINLWMHAPLPPDYKAP